MQDLLDSALDAGDIDVAHRALESISPEKLDNAETVRLQFDLIQNREHLSPLEARSRQALKVDDEKK